MKPTLSHWLEYAAIRLVCGFFSLLPHRLALALAWGPARLVWSLSGRLRRRTYRRLRQALGEAAGSEARFRRLGWLAFRNFVFSGVESLRLAASNRGWVERSFDKERLLPLRAELEQGGGIIIALPHLGNWELAGLALHAAGIRLLTVARRQKNPLMDDWLYRLRTATGVEVVDNRSRQVAEVARRMKQENKVLALLPDVRAKTGGVKVNFLGTATEVPGGVAYFAREANRPVLTAEVVREGWTRHAWRLTGRIEPDPNLDEATDARRILQYVMDRFTESIRTRPENYFWFNKRWVLGVEEVP